MSKRIPLPQETIDHIKAEMLDRYDFAFSDAQVQRICREAGLVRRFRYWGCTDTDERGMWLDAIALKFVGCHWPCNSENVNQCIAQQTGTKFVTHKEFPRLLVHGYERYRRNSARHGGV
jgi:hypothetical protein